MTSPGADVASDAAGWGADEAGVGALGVVGGRGGSGREGCEVAGSCGSGVLDRGGGSIDSVHCIATEELQQIYEALPVGWRVY